MRLVPLLLVPGFMALIVADVVADESAAPRPARPYTVSCAPTINVWVEADRDSLPARAPVNTEKPKRVQFSLIGSMTYRGDAVLCNYATRRRDVAVSYTVHCPQPRQQRGHKHSYTCQ